MQANYVQRLRLTFGKMGPTRFIGHLDLARTLERSLNRAEIPLAYTQGYNPRPRLQFAAALPLGFTSTCELADIWLLESVDPNEAKEKLIRAMAPGIIVHSLREVDLNGGAVQNQIRAAIYQVMMLDPIDVPLVQESIEELWASDSIIRERRGKNYNLRPLIDELSCQVTDDNQALLTMKLSLLPSKTGRPDEVLMALDLDPLAARIERTQFIFIDS
jgi:radical SAM-linked protein